MKTRSFFWSLFLQTTVALATVSVARAEPLNGGIESDSGIYGPKYDQIVGEMQSLAQKFPNLVTVVTIGTTPQGRPMTLLKLEQAGLQGSRQIQRNAVFFSGATHGDEYLGIEDKLARVFLENLDRLHGVSRYLKTGGVIYVLPIANPDGYEARQRENARGKDLNRDFTVKAAGVVGFTQPEMSNVARFIDSELKSKNLRLRLTLDYHCCAGVLLYPWSFKKPVPPVMSEPVDAAHRAVGRLMQNYFTTSYQYGKTPDLLGYSATGTSKDYYFETYGSLSFTFEGVYKQEAEKLDLHTQMWDAIFAGLVPASAQRRF